MRWAMYVDATGADRAGLVLDDGIHPLESGERLIDLLGDDGERLAHAEDRARSGLADVVPVDAVRLLAPIPRPPSVRDFYAFEQHVKTARQRRGLEMDPDWYELPVFYFSNPYAVNGPGDEVSAPPGSGSGPPLGRRTCSGWGTSGCWRR